MSARIALPSVFSIVPGDSETLLEDPPETPAPMFAVRAFKSAIFGTPHPAQPVLPSNHSLKQSDQIPPPGPPAPAEPLKMVHPEPRIGDIKRNLNLEAFVSPTKGILLTPGTGAARRKNVTFRGINSDEKSEAKESRKVDLPGNTKTKAPSSRSRSGSLAENERRPTSLTKALYKAKNGVTSENAIRAPDITKSNKVLAFNRDATVIEKEGYDADFAADVTIDLNHPLSRSGQHWKAEFEQYHKKSDREMKKIIELNQNVKLYAAKKDLEASDLGEKLRRELSKVATMESKVTDLATQLAATRTQGSKETPDQTRLVNDLARQTALAIQYKQKADNYEVALTAKNISLAPEPSRLEDSVSQDIGVESNQRRSEPTSPKRQGQDLASLRLELDRFRSSAEAAKQKAAKLETENLALQAAIDNLREGMKTSELRRQAREESLRKREEALKASKANCDAQWLKLLSQNEALLQNGQQQASHVTAEPSTFEAHQKNSSNQTSGDNAVAGQAPGSKDSPKPRKNAHRHKSDSSFVDIWTFQDSTLPLEKPVKKQEAARSLPKVLKEITQNPVREDETRKPHRLTQSSAAPTPSKTQPANESRRFTLTSPKKLQSSTTKRTHERRSTISTTQPSLLNFASSPPKPVTSTLHPTQPPDIKHQPPIHSTKIEPVTDRAAKPISVAAPTNAAEKKGSEPPAPAPLDRKEAMRARMAERMAEKRKAREGKGERRIG